MSPLTDEELQDVMKEFIGIRYKYGGASTTGLDCSGFVKVIYDKYFGIGLPHQSLQQSRSSQLEPVSLDKLRTGDLLFFSIDNKKNAVNHVGIYLSNGEFIHSGRSSGVTISSLRTHYWRSKILLAKRLTNRDEINTGVIFMDMGFLYSLEEPDTFYGEKFILPGYPGLLDDSQSSNYDLNENFRRLELGYTGTYDTELTYGISMFKESFLRTENGIRRADLSALDQYLSEVRPFHIQGLKLSGRINVLDNLSIIPSVSYIYSDTDLHTNNIPRLTLNLKYGLFSSTDRWSFTGGFHVPIRKNANSDLMDDFYNNTIGLSLTYQRQLSDNFSFIFTGNNFINAYNSYNGFQDYSYRAGSEKNYNLMIKIKY